MGSLKDAYIPVQLIPDIGKVQKLTIDYLKVEKLERNFDLGPPTDAKINVNNALIMWEVIQQMNANNVSSQVQ